MIAGTSLSLVLHALATGHPDRAGSLIDQEFDVDGALRDSLSSAIRENPDPAVQAASLGDVLRDASADDGLVNECYRLAFYLSDEPSRLSSNPLYAWFVANKARWTIDKWPHYFEIYERHFDRFRGRPVRMLEIGVYRGGGLAMWSHYLGPQAEIVGLDVDQTAVDAVNGRFPVVLGDQSDPDVLLRLDEQYGPFDIVVDDGGHAMEQQITTVETLLPRMNEGGVFLCEDTHTSYDPEFGGGLREEGSFVEWAKSRVDDLHWRHHHATEATSTWASEVGGIHCYDSVIVLDKGKRFRPFNEVTGTASFVHAARFSEIIGTELVATRDQALRAYETLRTEVDGGSSSEELRLVRAELANARRELASLSRREDELIETREELADSWRQIRAIRSSRSWRMTRPLRAVKRRRSP